MSSAPFIRSGVELDYRTLAGRAAPLGSLVVKPRIDPNPEICATPECDEPRVSPYFCLPHQDRMDRIRAEFEAEERKVNSWKRTDHSDYNWRERDVKHREPTEWENAYE
jgi:hypothetical protein